MKKLTKYVLTISIFLLFLMPVVSNAAQAEDCNLTNSKVFSLTSNNIGDLQDILNNKGDLQELLDGFVKTCPTYILEDKNLQDLIAECQVNVPAAEKTAEPAANNEEKPDTIITAQKQEVSAPSPTETDDSQAQDTPTPAVESPSGSYEQQVIDLVNQERAKNGLQPLSENTELSKVAETKAADMRDNNYFSHTSPVYGSPFDMMKQFGIQYSTAGENIAKGQRTPQEVMNGWMNSEGHRANILNSNFTEIGVGYVTDSNGNTYWVQQFIRP